MASIEYERWLRRSNRGSMFDNTVVLSNEPGYCSNCGIQFEDGETVDFDHNLPFTYTMGRTVRNKYPVHPEIYHAHVKPTCDEVKEMWNYKESVDRNRV